MKIFFRVLFIGFLVFFGFQLYSCSSKGAYNRELVKQGDIAYDTGDYSLFKGIFEYYQDEPYVNKEISLVDADNRYGIEERDISFTLVVYLQAEKGKNHLTIILTDLVMEDPEFSLKTVLKKDEGNNVEEYLFRMSSKNWYIQYFEFDTEKIDQLIITHTGSSSVESIVLFNSKDYERFEEHFLSKEEKDLALMIESGKMEENGIVKREEDPFAGKGLSVIIVLAIYGFISAVIIFAMFSKGKSKTKPSTSDLNRNRIKKQNKEDTK